MAISLMVREEGMLLSARTNDFFHIVYLLPNSKNTFSGDLTAGKEVKFLVIRKSKQTYDNAGFNSK